MRAGIVEEPRSRCRSMLEKILWRVRVFRGKIINEDRCCDDFPHPICSKIFYKLRFQTCAIVTWKHWQCGFQHLGPTPSPPDWQRYRWVFPFIFYQWAIPHGLLPTNASATSNTRRRKSESLHFFLGCFVLMRINHWRARFSHFSFFLCVGRPIR